MASAYKITTEGMPLFAIAFCAMGVNIYVSSMFTALSDGRTSAIISFARTLVFLVGALMLLPIFLKETGLWLAVVPLPGQKKNKQVVLTEVGKVLAKNRIYPIIAAEQAAFGNLNNEEQESLLTLTKKYIELLQAEINKIK